MIRSILRVLFFLIAIVDIIWGISILINLDLSDLNNDAWWWSFLIIIPSGGIIRSYFEYEEGKMATTHQYIVFGSYIVFLVLALLISYVLSFAIIYIFTVYWSGKNLSDSLKPSNFKDSLINHTNFYESQVNEISTLTKANGVFGIFIVASSIGNLELTNLQIDLPDILQYSIMVPDYFALIFPGTISLNNFLVYISLLILNLKAIFTIHDEELGTKIGMAIITSFISIYFMNQYQMIELLGQFGIIVGIIGWGLAYLINEFE